MSPTPYHRPRRGQPMKTARTFLMPAASFHLTTSAASPRRAAASRVSHALLLLMCAVMLQGCFIVFIDPVRDALDRYLFDTRAYFSRTLTRLNAPSETICDVEVSTASVLNQITGRGFGINPQHHILHLSASAESHGLRRGDKVLRVAVNTSSPSSSAESVSSPVRETLITVERQNQTLGVLMPCRDSSSARHAFRAGILSASTGDWTSCAASLQTVLRLLEFETSELAVLRLRCIISQDIRAKGRELRRGPDVAAVLHLVTGLVVEEGTYLPEGAARAQDFTLAAIAILNSLEFYDLADDIQTRFGQRPQDTIE